MYIDHLSTHCFHHHFDRLVQERCYSSALAMELHLSCTNPSIWRDYLCQGVITIWQIFGNSECWVVSQGQNMSCNIKRKPPCISVMELVSLSRNRIFISSDSIGRGWCKIAIATKWYQLHTTDKCGFLFMPGITNQYTFVRYTKLVNKMGAAVAQVITFSIMKT